MKKVKAFLSLVALVVVQGGMAARSDAAAPPRLTAVRTAQPPELDGRGDDAVWRDAKPLTVTFRTAVSVHDRTGDMDKAAELIVLAFQK